MTRKVLDVFLSSTAEDLKAFRAEIYRRLVSKGIFHCVRQEDFGAQDAKAVDFCRERAQAADIFVGLIGLRRGWEPKGDKARRSITEMEHDWARKAGVRRYLWVAPHDFPVAGHIRESDALHARQQAFRAKVMANGERIVSQAGFGSPELLAADVVDRLLIEVVTSDLIRELRPELSGQVGSEDQRPAVVAAVERLVVDKDVDLLALAKNPEGVDLAELEAKLKTRAEKLSSESAEYWRHIGALAFFHDTQKSLAAYEKAIAFDPSDSEGLRFLGELQFRLGDLVAAERAFSALANVLQDRSRSIGYIRLGWLHRVRGDLPAAETITMEALSLAERAQWLEGIARAHSNLGFIHQTRGDFDRAEKMHLKALAVEEALGSKEGVARAYGNLGLIHQMRGDFEKSKAMQLKSLALYEALGGKEGMARAYNNIGVIYEADGDLDQAEEMQLMALALNEALGRKEGIANAYCNLGIIYQKRGELDRAEEIQIEALAMYEAVGSKEVAYAYAALGVVHQTCGDLDRAEEMQIKALTVNGVHGSKEVMAIAYDNLARIHHAKNCRHRMFEYGRKSLNLWREMGLEGKAVEAEQWLRANGCDT